MLSSADCTRTSRMSAAPSFSSSTITPGRARDPLVVVGGSRWLLSSTKPKGTWRYRVKDVSTIRAVMLSIHQTPKTTSTDIWYSKPQSADVRKTDCAPRSGIKDQINLLTCCDTRGSPLSCIVSLVIHGSLSILSAAVPFSSSHPKSHFNNLNIQSRDQ